MSDFRAGYQRIAFWVFLVVAIVLVGLIVAPFVPAIIWAGVLGTLVYRPFVNLRRGLERRIPALWAENIAALFYTVVAAVVILIPFLIIGTGVYTQVSDIAEQIADARAPGDEVTVETFVGYVDGVLAPVLNQFGIRDFDLGDYFARNREQIVETLRAPLGRFAGQVVFTVWTLFIAFLTLYFVLRDADKMREAALDLIPLPRREAHAALLRLEETIQAVFTGTVLVAILQGGLMGFAFAYVGLPNAVVLGVVSILLAIIPLLGAPVVYIPVGLMFIAQGNIRDAAIILGFGGLFVSNVDNVIKPFLIGGRAKLHPMIVFFSILGGVLLIGPIGVMVGPVAIALLLFLADLLRRRMELAEAADSAGPA